MSGYRKLAVLAALLIIVGSLALVSANYRRPTKVITHCCKSVTKGKILYEITDYKQQNSLNHCVKAIIFQTKKNGKFCTDPKAPWVSKKIKELRKRS